MRHLIALGLSLCVVGSAVAQTEVIIRRPGQKDQVIRLDTTRAREMTARLQAELKNQTREIQNRVKLLQRDVSANRVHFDTAPMMLALRSGELAATVARDHATALERSLDNLKIALRQPHIGVGVDTRPRESDKYGAYIQSVTPGSPADKAGILSGDIITRVAGKSLTEKASKNESEETTPGLRLISMIIKLPVGRPVDIELRRGAQNRTVKVTPVEDETVAMVRRLPDQLSGNLSLTLPGEIASRAAAMPAWAPEIASPSFNIFANGGAYFYSFGGNGLFANLELAPLNEKLGAYFGTTEGVLVISTMPERKAFYQMDTMFRAGGGGRGAFAGGRGGGGGGRGVRTDSMARSGVIFTIPTVRTQVDTIRIPGRPDSIRTRTFVRGGRADSNVTYIDGVPVQPSMVARKTVNIGLEPGDVIVSVDGRKVTTPSQLMRIVGTYDRGEEFKLQIMRQKRAETLTVKMP